MRKIMVLGAGTMGSGIAQAAATAGFSVLLCDVAEEAVVHGFHVIEKNLSNAVKKGKLDEYEKKRILALIATTTEKSRAVEVDLVIEAIVENIDVKKKVLAELDEICPSHTILASNTSALSITEIARATKRPHQVIGMHFFNPVPVMKLVEVIRGEDASDETVEVIKELAEKMGKQPVDVKEAPGFIVNRILIPMINEAAFLLMEGVSSADDIDTAMKLGANHPIGPLALGDLVGLDVCLAIMETLYNETGDSKYRPCPLLRKKVRAGHLGRKSGQGFFVY
ncbi:3-hydroxybutyryl-CoA dehydrogenase [Thermanaerosceptrum fracticalcis]|uniref:3-hydroxybutyryl-CoA dehydrogenase n=1 Tax=Thermanaerosceptrum fracticalcis TaxID=1712410 RepID=A0A7G6E8J0_THEFR|nr:3-hydroxybutyryl-CoA dehydrogenase [Thermanaerosceptrum fracticalcis]QNB48394.1 3-hydroxybutyryl-CoA dehydrogenase [Thermanaerosceptrum fracticalcis]